MKNIKIALAEDDKNCVDEIKHILNQDNKFEICRVYNSYTEIKNNLELTECDILILDLQFSDGNALELIESLKEKNKALKILVHTVFEDVDTIIKALGLGAHGYLTKNTSHELLRHELKSVMLGGAPLTKLVAERLSEIFEQSKSEQNLAPREIEILDLISLGFTYQQIAEELCISPQTVRTHIRNIYEKLNVHSKSEAIMKGYRLGFISKLFKG